MKIKISDGARKSLTDDEYKYLLLLELHDDFENIINKKRAKLGIPQYSETERLTAITLADSLNTSKIASDSEIRMSTIEIIKKLNLPVSLYFATKAVLQYGQIDYLDDPITVHSIDSYLSGRTRAERLFLDYDFPYEISYPTITIKKRLNKEQLFREIEDRWWKIEELMKVLEKFSNPTVLVTKISVRDVEESIEIYKLRKKDVKYEDMRNRLHLEGASLRQKYSKLKKLLKKLKFVK